MSLGSDTVLVSEPEIGAFVIEAGVEASEIIECDSDSFGDPVAEVTVGNGDVLLARWVGLRVDGC